MQASVTAGEITRYLGKEFLHQLFHAAQEGWRQPAPAAVSSGAPVELDGCAPCPQGEAARSGEAEDWVRDLVRAGVSGWGVLVLFAVFPAGMAMAVRAAAAPEPRGKGSRPRARPGGAKEPAFWNRLLPGQYLLLWYSDDDVYHEALFLWKAGGRKGCVHTPDNDTYITSLWGSLEEGPVEVLELPADGSLPDDLGADTYRFRANPDEVKLKSLLREAHEEARRRGLAPVEHTKVVNHVGEIVGLDELFGGQFVERRVRGRGEAGKVGGSVPASPASARAPRGVGRCCGQEEEQDWVWLWLVSEPGHPVEMGGEVPMGEGSMTGGRYGIGRSLHAR